MRLHAGLHSLPLLRRRACAACWDGACPVGSSACQGVRQPAVLSPSPTCTHLPPVPPSKPCPSDNPQLRYLRVCFLRRRSSSGGGLARQQRAGCKRRSRALSPRPAAAGHAAQQRRSEQRRKSRPKPAVVVRGLPADTTAERLGEVFGVAGALQAQGEAVGRGSARCEPPLRVGPDVGAACSGRRHDTSCEALCRTVNQALWKALRFCHSGGGRQQLQSPTTWSWTQPAHPATPHHLPTPCLPQAPSGGCWWWRTKRGAAQALRSSLSTTSQPCRWVWLVWGGGGGGGGYVCVCGGGGGGG